MADKTIFTDRPDYPDADDVKLGVEYGHGSFSGSMAAAPSFYLTPSSSGRNALMIEYYDDGYGVTFGLTPGWWQFVGAASIGVDVSVIPQYIAEGMNWFWMSENDNLTSITFGENMWLYDPDSMEIRNNPLLTTVSGIPYLFHAFESPNGQLWYDFSGNALNVAAVDAFLDSVATLATTYSYSYLALYLDGGTNAVPTDGSSNADVLALVALDWDVYINT